MAYIQLNGHQPELSRGSFQFVSVPTAENRLPPTRLTAVRQARLNRWAATVVAVLPVSVPAMMGPPSSDLHPAAASPTETRLKRVGAHVTPSWFAGNREVLKTALTPSEPTPRTKPYPSSPPDHPSLLGPEKKRTRAAAAAPEGKGTAKKR